MILLLFFFIICIIQILNSTENTDIHAKDVKNYFSLLDKNYATVLISTICYQNKINLETVSKNVDCMIKEGEIK